jgi:hypothetical protein
MRGRPVAARFVRDRWKEASMTTVLHEEPRAWWAMRDVWIAVAITSMWLSVAVTALAGPDIHGTDGSTVPAAIPIALFALIGSWILAHYGFRRRA